MAETEQTPEIVVIGGAVADILVCPVTEEVFRTGSHPADSIQMRPGGDAVNEATVIARLGHAPLLVTKLGEDGVGEYLTAHCRREGIRTVVAREKGVATSTNVVLVSPSGERSFITCKDTSLRRLTLQDALPVLDDALCAPARMVCLASMFVSPPLGPEEMEALFARVKAQGRILCADTTKRKNGERIADVAGALKHLDYFFPNLDEARLLAGAEDPDALADAFLESGVKTIVLKLGGRGCLVRGGRVDCVVPAFADARCLDTTGAGDTFAAAFMTALLEGHSPRECGAFANAAASVCIEHLGAMSDAFDRAEVERRAKIILG